MPNSPSVTAGSNRAAPDSELDEFVAGIAARMGAFPRDALIAAKSAIKAISLPTPADVRADVACSSSLFGVRQRSNARQRVSSGDPGRDASGEGAPVEEAWFDKTEAGELQGIAEEVIRQLREREERMAERDKGDQ